MIVLVTDAQHNELNTLCEKRLDYLRQQIKTFLICEPRDHADKRNIRFDGEMPLALGKQPAYFSARLSSVSASKTAQQYSDPWWDSFPSNRCH